MKKGIMIVVFFILLLVALFCGFRYGSINLSLEEVWIGLTNKSDSHLYFVIWENRLPRVFLSIMAGAIMAVTGSILQGIVGNPLASPDVIGISKGAGFFAVIFVILMPNSPPGMLPIAAFCGAMVAGVILWFLSNKNQIKGSYLALYGIGISTVFSALIQYITVKNSYDANMAMIWLSGSLWGRGWFHVAVIFPFFILLPLIILLISDKLDVLALGDNVAAALGVHVKRTKTVLLFLSVLLTGVSVAMVGTIGFVGLIAPHIAKKLAGPKHVQNLFLSAYIGAMLILVSDIIGRVIIQPKEVPAGIICAVIGAPYFMALLKKKRNKS